MLPLHHACITLLPLPLLYSTTLHILLPYTLSYSILGIGVGV
jgi:hypothetical protein